MKRSRRTFLKTTIPLTLGGLVIPTIISSETSAQQEGIALRHGRMSSVEALGRIDRANNELSNLQEIYRKEPSFEEEEVSTRDRQSQGASWTDIFYKISEGELTPDFKKINENLLEILRNCDDRESLYKANFMMSRLMFNFNRARSKIALKISEKSDPDWEKRYGGIEVSFMSNDYDINAHPVHIKGRGLFYDFTETWDFIERTIIEFPEQEEKFGLGFGGLEKMSDAFAKISENCKSFVDISRCYELANEHSTYSQKDTNKLKKNLDQYLSLSYSSSIKLSEFLRSIFPEGVEAESWSTDKETDRKKRDYRLTRGKSGYHVNWEFRPHSVFNYLEELKIKLIFGKSRPFPEINFKPVHLGENIQIHIENMEGAEYKKDNKMFYRSGRSSMGKEVRVKSKVKFGEFLRLGGIDPYNWCYDKNTQRRSNSLGSGNW